MADPTPLSPAQTPSEVPGVPSDVDRGAAETIREFIAVVAARRRRARLLDLASRGLLGGALAAIAYLIALHTVLSQRGPWTYLAALFPIAGILLAITRVRWQRISDYETAKDADDRLGLADQLAAAWDFTRQRRDTPLARITIRRVADALARPGILQTAAPILLPMPLGIAIALILVNVFVHARLFPAPERMSDATRRELLAGQRSIEGLLELHADLTDAGQSKEFERIRKLVEDLNLLSDTATKDEILARLSREIEDLDSRGGGDDTLARALDELKKYRDRVAMGDLMDEAQKELDKAADELAVVTGEGQKVSAEAIQTLALVEKQALAEKRAKQDALADELKTVAKEQREKEEAAGREWDIAKKEDTEAAAGEAKELKRGPLTYDALRSAVENRDIRAMILGAASDPTRSTEAYREVFQNYHRILESVIFHQRVPSGQELYVRRYFQVIRPKRK